MTPLADLNSSILAAGPAPHGDSQVRIHVSWMRYSSAADLRDFLDTGSRRDAFTDAEALYCSARPGIERWAARLSAKLAVLELLGLSGRAPLSDVEVLPGRHESNDDIERPCILGHPPRLVLHGTVAVLAGAATVTVSVTHNGQGAAAVAMITSGRKEGCREQQQLTSSVRRLGSSRARPADAVRPFSTRPGPLP